MTLLARPGFLRTLAALAVGALLVSTGCDKLKAAVGKDDAGSTSGGTGLSFLGSDFEGEISMNLTSKSKPQTTAGITQMVLGMKKPKYRVDTVASGQSGQTAPGSLLIDLSTKKGYALSHPQKTAIVIDFDKMKNLQGYGIPGLPGSKSPTVPKTPPTIEKTGKKDVVAGYTCEIWNVSLPPSPREGKKAQLCVAEGITWIDVSDLGFSSPEMTLAAVTTEANRFPLRVIAFDAQGTEEMRMEASKVDKKKMDDSRFIVPPDYRVVDMSGLMGGGLPGIPSNLPNFKPR